LRGFSRRDDEFLAFCGTLGLGRLLAAGDREAEGELHRLAQDDRWRVREAVAMALQRLGDDDEARMVAVVDAWAGDPSLLVRRAAIAGACEPRLLTDVEVTRRVLDVLERVTGELAGTPPDERGAEPFRVLRQALGYCWSVAVAAAPEEGFERFEQWVGAEDRDVRWVVRRNLTKSRLRKADPDRCVRLEARLG
jgi:hypothetical protein